MTNQVTESVSSVIQLFSFEKKDVDTIQHCIASYSKPESAQDTLIWAICRVWNAIKRLLEQSDWQIAKRTLEKKWTSLDPFNLREFVPQGLRLSVTSWIIDPVDEYALNCLVHWNENRTDVPAKTIQLANITLLFVKMLNTIQQQPANASLPSHNFLDIDVD